jgi:ferredoxin-NADP reductase
MAEKRTGRITKIVQENYDTKTFRVSLDGSFVKFQPGQFFNLFLFNPDGTFDARSYSVASSPARYWYDFTIKLVPGGRFSERLAKIKEGEKCQVMGPFGRMYFDEAKGNHIVLVAGGVGITPLASIARYARDKKLDASIVLFYTVRKEEDLLFKKELEDFAKSTKNFVFVPTITREAAEGWKGETGRIDEKMVKRHVKDPQKATYFLCGSTEMVKGISEMLEKMGVPKEKIEFEDWVK